MIKRKLLFTVILSIALVFAMIFTACSDPVPEEEVIPPPPTVAKPVIRDQSGTKRYQSGSSVTTELSVTATVNDTEPVVPTYQWYSRDSFGNTGGTQIVGESGVLTLDGNGIGTMTYQASADDVGTTYYYVVVTNPARVDVNPETNEEKDLAEAATASAPIGVIVIAALPDPEATVTVTATGNQYVRGFGGMSNAFGIGSPARYMQMADIDTMFGPDGMGLTMLRIMIWPYPLDQVISGQIEPQMGNAGTYLNAVRKVNEYGGYVLASPWTAPAEYKTNESLEAGGHLKTERYVDYAQYLRTFASEMAARGAPIYAISLQNEPSLTVTYDGMEWTEAEHRNFLRDRGNFTRSPTPVAGYGGGTTQPFVKVVSGEAHQIGSWYTAAMDYVIANPAAYANMDIVAYHIYGGIGTLADVTRDGTLNKETWMTEHNINSQSESLYRQDSTWNYVWVVADEIHHIIGINNSSAFVWWYLKRFYGAVGDGSYGTANGAIMPRGYVLSHYAKYATDTVRVNATTNHPGGSSIALTAFQRKKTADKTTENELQVMADEDSYSIVIYDKRTTASGQTSLRVTLPTGFEATKVTGIISDSTGNRHAPVNVILNPDGNSADVSLPTNAIISLKFVK